MNEKRLGFICAGARGACVCEQFYLLIKIQVKWEKNKKKKKKEWMKQTGKVFYVFDSLLVGLPLLNEVRKREPETK